MSDRLNSCKALAAMIRAHGEVDVDELRFIAHVALELGLDQDQNSEVQGVLKDGGDFKALVESVGSRDMQLFLFRQIVAAALVDEHVNESELGYINTAAERFKISADIKDQFVSWMREGVDWERRGAALVEKML